MINRELAFKFHSGIDLCLCVHVIKGKINAESKRAKNCFRQYQAGGCVTCLYVKHVLFKCQINDQFPWNQTIRFLLLISLLIWVKIKLFPKDEIPLIWQKNQYLSVSKPSMWKIVLCPTSACSRRILNHYHSLLLMCHPTPTNLQRFWSLTACSSVFSWKNVSPIPQGK